MIYCNTMICPALVSASIYLTILIIVCLTKIGLFSWVGYYKHMYNCTVLNFVSLYFIFLSFLFGAGYVTNEAIYKPEYID